MKNLRNAKSITSFVSATLATLGLLSSSVWAGGWTVQNDVARQEALKNALNGFNGNISASARDAKYAKMDDSAFVFYRGTAHWYYQDMQAYNVIASSDFYHQDAKVWLQGDLHVQNYGAFDDDTETVVFDLNDFDESWVESYLYDVYRASASLILVAKAQGFTQSSQQQAIVDAFSEYYLDTLESYRLNNNEHDFKLTKANAYGRLDEFLTDAQNDNSRKKMLNKWSIDGGAARYFDLNNPDLAPVSSGLKSAIVGAIGQYHQHLTSSLAGNSSYFTVLDVAERLNAGTGSLGTERYYVLIEGSSSGDDDDRILDVKLQGLPSIYPFISANSQAHMMAFYPLTQQGCRVTDAQKALLNDADDHLGCATVNGKSFSVRERSAYKESFDTSELTSITRFTKLAQQWAMVLASAHARADQDANSQIVATNFEQVMDDIADTKHSEFRAEVFAFATAYAAQVESDYLRFLTLLNSGQL